jgi:hypothetical protein
MLIIPTLNGENKFLGFRSGTIYATTGLMPSTALEY